MDYLARTPAALFQKVNILYGIAHSALNRGHRWIIKRVFYFGKFLFFLLKSDTEFLFMRILVFDDISKDKRLLEASLYGQQV